jgi:hypothetical protein
MGKKIRVWDGTAWQDVAPSLPYTAIHSAQASMPATGVDGQVWLDTDGALSDTAFVPLSGGTMTGNLNTPSINSGGISGQNYCINGNFDIFQRASFTSSSAGYCLDRWYAWSNGGSMTVTQQTSGAPIGSKYYMRVAYNALNVCNIWQFIEHDDVKMLQGKIVTLSAKIRRNSAFTPNYVLGVYKAPTANASAGGTWSQVGAVGAANANIPTGTSSNDWFTFSTTVTIPADGTAEGLAIVLFENAAGPSGAYIEISQVKLEIGSSITPITRSGGTIAGELAACQRYYWRTSPILGSGGYARYSGFSPAVSSTGILAVVQNPVPMRIRPTSIDYLNVATYDNTNIGGTVSSLSLNGDTTIYQSYVVVGTSGLTQYRPYQLMASNTSNSYLGFSAEL